METKNKYDGSMSASKARLGLGWIAFALIFFFNPNINVIDFLPDFIGYIFLCVGFSKLADLNESVGSAVAGFGKMILIDAGKWLALFWIFGMSLPSERNSSLLLWTFVFSVLELIFAIPAFSKLFGGLTQLGYFYPNTALFGDPARKKKKTPTDRMRWLTMLFLGTKAVFAVLPEFADLSNAAYDESSGMINLYQYIGVMRLLAFVPVLLFGLYWLLRAQLYFRRIRKDRPLMVGLAQRYKLFVLPKKGMFVRRAFRGARVLLILALVMTLDFRVDNMNFLPDILAAILFFAAFVLLRRHIGVRTVAWVLPNLVYGGLTVFTAVAEYSFFDQYYYGAIMKSEEAMNAYGAVILCTILQAASFLLFLWLMVRSLNRVITDHTGYVEGRERIGVTEEGMVRDLQKEQKRLLIYGFVGAVIYGLADVAYVFLAPDFGFAGLIQLGAALLCVALFVRALSYIQTSIDTKYMLE